MSSLLCNRGAFFVAKCLKNRLIQLQIYDKGSSLLRHFEAFNLEGRRGLRRARLPVSSDGTFHHNPGPKLVSGEDLLRELEDERRNFQRKKVVPDDPFVSRIRSGIKQRDARVKETENIYSHKSSKIHPEKYEDKLEFNKKHKSSEVIDQKPKSSAQIRKEKFQLINQNRNTEPRIEKNEKEQIVITSENQFEILNQVICPLFEMPYEDQLEMKSRTHSDLLARLGKVLPNAKVRSRGKIISSDVLTEYRSKDEFGIQKGIDGNYKTVGFFVGSSKTQLLCVEPPHIPIIKDSHIRVAASFQDYIRHHSTLPARLSEGFWRSLVVMSGNNNERIMANVIAKVEGISEEQVASEKSKLEEFFRDGFGREANVTTLYFQHYPIDQGGGKKSRCEIIFGPPRIPIELFGHQFEIGPQTYFPGNLPTTEKFLKLLRPLSKLKVEDNKDNNSSTFSNRRRQKKVTLLEVGCGAGIHSILLSNVFHHCVGFDSCDVSDAINNAQTLGASNKCSFVSGPYLKTFPQYLRNLENEAANGVVILNTGRVAVDRELIGQIRGCSLIKKVIYISGKPEGDSFNCFRDLCREVTQETKKNKYSIVPISRHFVLTHAFPVDLYPHTNYCEHVLVFSRY